MRETLLQLRERIKELTCLYCIAQLAEQPGNRNRRTAARRGGAIAAGLAVSRDCGGADHAWTTTATRRLTSASVPTSRCVDLVIKGQPRGSIEVGYTREMPRA